MGQIADDVESIRGSLASLFVLLVSSRGARMLAWRRLTYDEELSNFLNFLTGNRHCKTEAEW